MAKPIKCNIKLHGSYKEIHLPRVFESISKAKKYINVFWVRPYTIVRLKDNKL